MTTTTIYGDTMEGWGADSSSIYSLARAMDNPSLNTTSPASIGQHRINTIRICYQYSCNFDTSAIPDSDTISSATVSLYGHTDVSTTDFTIEARAITLSSPLSANDFIPGASLSGATLYASFATSGFNASGYNDFTSEAGFPAAINKTGMTGINFSSSRHRAGNDPSGAEYVQVFSVPETGTANDPKIVIEHEGAGGGVPKTNRLSLMGVG